MTCELIDLLQVGPDEWPHQIVVVDDGSPMPFPNVSGVRVLRIEPNQGFGHAVNSGVGAAIHDVVLVLNSDLRPGPGFVDDMMLAAQDEFPALTAPQVTENGVVMRNATYFPDVWSAASSRSALPVVRNRSQPAAAQRRTVSGNLEVAWVSGAALCFQRTVWEAVGGFDEDFFMYMEDVDLQFRMHQRGIRRVLLDRVLVEHLGAGSSTEGRRRTWMVDSTFVYFKKRGRLGALTVSWVAMIASNLLYDVLRRLCGRQVNPWKSATSQQRLMASGLASARRASRSHKAPS